MSDWRSYGEGLSQEYKFPSGVPDFQNSVGAANAKIDRIKRTCIKDQSEQKLYSKSKTSVGSKLLLTTPLSKANSRT